MQKLDLTIEEVDALTGPVIGLPKSASFRLLDIVGLDVWNLVSKNLYDLVPDDPWRERFLPQPFLGEMLSRGWLGDKTGQGFFQRRGPKKEIWAIDWKTFEYHPAAKVKLPALENAKLIEDLPTRLRTLYADSSKAGEFYRGLFDDVYAYASAMLPQIAHSADDIDHAMQWGYAHTVGPFGIARILGLKPPPPEPVETPRPGIVVLRQQPVVQANPGASCAISATVASAWSSTPR